jgi:signal transduction histidine kinase
MNEREIDYTNIEKHLTENYFSFLKQNYETNLTLCDSTTQLLVDFEEDATRCYDYFDGIVQEMGRKSLTKGLYYIDDGDAVRNYLLVIPVSQNQRIFVDIFEKNSPFTQGYPELLEMESDKKRLADKFDYAIYWDDDLISSFGDHSYPLVFNEDELMKEPTIANHLFRDGRKKIVITLERNHLTNAIAGTSYLFIAFGLIFFFFYLLIIQKISREYLNRFRNRLQASIFSILLLTFVVIGYFMFTHIVHQNTEKNVANLQQLSHSILIELEHKFSQFDDIDDAEQQYTFSQLVKFSKVFFSDINLYDPAGNLVASSRPQVFERDIISDRIHKEAFVKLRNQSLRMFIMREKIGNYEFLSSYFPLRNYNNDIIAYANLPYFSRQKRLTEEIADFLTTFINIYVVLTVLSLFLIWVTSNYITKPMETIKKSLRQTKLAKSNIKIEMNRKDEIGELVQEYNSMVDELEQSAKKLAVSERESAWREMAKQVAHEIKNPLTPMKLSVQHISRVINTSDEESKNALKRFTENMIDQIESLSEIASAFSDFAKMPVIKLSRVDVYNVASNTISLFEGLPNIDIQVSGETAYIKGDEKQLRRVFINLLKNAVQALEGVSDGKIIVTITKQDDRIMVFIEDNGKGIPEDKIDKIFLPNFTTKSSGAGLGLAMVKNIMTNFGGTIELVETTENGTIFRLSFPEMNETAEENE